MLVPNALSYLDPANRSTMNLRPLFSLPLLGLLSGSLCAQSLSPTAIASAGGTRTAGGVTLSWTVGETAVQTLDNGTNILTQG
ncbi:MAG: hypothetical protein KDE51_11405, partial [Anaerolineales bacterium]|nr:hypothetical protein [Anaerolineales bacterium]